MIPLRDSEVMKSKTLAISILKKKTAKWKWEGFLQLAAKAKLFHVGE
jgi:hypothetical protein